MLNPALEASCLNFFNINSHLLAPYVRQFLLGNRTRRPVQPSPSPQQLTKSQGPTSKSTGVDEPGELVYSIIEGEKVMGFNVWGEVRLCLPHLLRFVLNDMDIDEIGQAISRLKIACTKCSPRQLALLHMCSALPDEVTSCGLIRKSDAERMLKYLRSNKQRPTLAEVCLVTKNRPEEGEPPPGRKTSACSTKEELPVGPTADSGTVVDSSSARDQQSGVLEEFIDVRHDCFGRQRGRVYPHLYTSPSAPCILCHTCDQLFSPPDFVGHTHAVAELNSCCHWGFDSTNWRSYLRLDIHVESKEHPIERSDDLLSSSTKAEESEIGAYRLLKDFKVKFLKPLSFPDGIIGKLEKISSCSEHAARRVSRSNDSPLDCRTAKSSPACSTFDRQARGGSTSSSSPSASEGRCHTTTTATGITTTQCTASPLELRFRSNIVIRRLWAPHEGQLRMPHPPKLISDCPKGPKPPNLSSDPPVLLDPTCVVTKDAAHLYDRDFIPNVCLKPISAAHLSKSLTSVPSNDDILFEKRQSVSTEDICLPKLIPLADADWRRSRRTTASAPKHGVLTRGQVSNSSPRLDFMDSSPARSRHSSCAQDLPFSTPHISQAPSTRPSPTLAGVSSSVGLSMTDKSRRNRPRDGSLLKYFRSPSVELPGPTLPKTRLFRTASDPELSVPALAVNASVSPQKLAWERRQSSSQPGPCSPERPRPRSFSNSSCKSRPPSDARESINPDQSTRIPASMEAPNPSRPTYWPQSSVPNFTPPDYHPAVNCQKISGFETFQMPEPLFCWDLDSSTRIPNLVSHWVTLMEIVNDFARAVNPTEKQFSDPTNCKSSFELAQKKLYADLHAFRERHFAELSLILEENRKLRKLVTDALLLTGAPHSLTPNVLAPPFGKIPGVWGPDQPSTQTNLTPNFRPLQTTCMGFQRNTELRINATDSLKPAWPARDPDAPPPGLSISRRPPEVTNRFPGSVVDSTTGSSAAQFRTQSPTKAAVINGMGNATPSPNPGFDEHSTHRESTKRGASPPLRFPSGSNQRSTSDKWQERTQCNGASAPAPMNSEFIIPNKRQRLLFRHSYPDPVNHDFQARDL
nr:unnamed protein product [Spirometra erinaceieuropaei]